MNLELVKSSQYKCINCGEPMLALLALVEESGVVLREEPIACTRCTPFTEAKRTLAETFLLMRGRRLLAKLIDFYA
jgi:DNA-directed RNA polymerase subunit RPC12/RpoP